MANSSPPSRATQSLARVRPVEAIGKLADQIVAGRMAKRIVDVLEAVEIEVEERDARAVAPRLDQAAIEPVDEERAVGEPGQRIVKGQVLRLRLARLQLGRSAAQAAHEKRDPERPSE